MESRRVRKRNRRHINDNGTAVSSWYVVYGSLNECQRCLFAYLVEQLSLFNVDTSLETCLPRSDKVKQSGWGKSTAHVILEFSGADYTGVALSLYKTVSQPI